VFCFSSFLRDSMARAVYDKLFAWLVQKLNETIIP
jgi:myosin heavy subunit